MTTFSLRSKAVMLGVAAVGWSLSAHAGLADVEAGLKAGVAHQPRELLVQFKADQSATVRQQALKAVAARTLQSLRAAQAGRGELQRVVLPEGRSLLAAVKALQKMPGVAFAEPNWTIRAQAVAADSYYADGSQWGVYGATSPLQTNVYGSGAAVAWDHGNTCKKNMPAIGVIDEGIMVAHKDLNRNIWTNLLEADGLTDGDGNGMAGDVHGWDFFNGDASVFDDVSDDHGTQVAGIIAAKASTTGEQGIAGVCWWAQLIPAKIMNTGTGNVANAIAALDYMVDLKARHNLPLKAVTAAWGSNGYSEALEAAIARAGAADILVIAAAGNGGQNNDLFPFYPASYEQPNIISVTAIGSAGALPGFSNFGPKSVHLAAPGAGIYTTTPVYKSGAYKSSYAAMSGTSWAAAFVAGAVGLYQSSHPTASAAEIKAAILASTVPTPSLSGKVATGGRLDASGF